MNDCDSAGNYITHLSPSTAAFDSSNEPSCLKSESPAAGSSIPRYTTVAKTCYPADKVGIMANTLDSSCVEVRGLYQSPAGRSPTTSSHRPVPKLRDSCQACSASKVKCNRKKPTCERCEKRGLTCEYLVTRRAGRTKQRHNEPRMSSSAFLFGPSWPASTPSATATPTDCGPNLPSPAHMNLNALLTPPETSVVSPLTSLNAADLFGSPVMAFPGLDTLDFDPLCQSSFDFTTDHKNHGFFEGIGCAQPADSHFTLPRVPPEDTFSVMEDARIGQTRTANSGTLSPPFFNPDPKTDTGTGSSTSPGSGPDDAAPGCSGCCLLQATTLLQQLFANLPATCTPSSTSPKEGDDPNGSTTSNLEDVISKNKETIDKVNMMLNCPCSQDAYLLAIMALIVFKVLGWYAAVARETPKASSSESRPLPKSLYPDRRRSADGDLHGIDEEDYERRAGQVVLSELHCVQRLVNQLSQRLKADSIRCSLGPLSSAENATKTKTNSGKWSPFSPAMLDQLETDLRKGLRNLSSEIVNMLRRE